MPDEPMPEATQAQEVRSRHLLALVAELLRKNEELRMELAQLRDEPFISALRRPDASPAPWPEPYKFQA